MYSLSDIKRFEDFNAPLIKHGTIDSELFRVALEAVKDHLKQKIAGEGKPNEPDFQKPKLLTRSEVARILKCSEKQVDRLRKMGKLRTVKYSPRSVRIRLEDVEQLIANPLDASNVNEQLSTGHKTQLGN